MIHNVLDEMQSYLGAPVTKNSPSHIWIELVLDCNLDCQMCGTSRLERHGRMDFGLFRSLIDQVSSEVLAYSIFNWGETLLLRPPELEKYLDYLSLQKREDARIYVSTNGTLLDHDRCSLLISHNVEIDVSIDGCSPETFETIRRGADFETVRSNIERAVSIRDSRFPQSPPLGIYTTIQRDNIDELTGIVEMAQKLGVARIGFGFVVEPSEFRIPLTEENVRKIDEAVNRSMDLGLLVIEKPMRLGEYYWVGQHYSKNPTERVNTVCNAPHFLAAVNEIGKVSTCCCWPTTLGDLRKEGFRAIWLGSRFENLRSVVNTARAPETCLGCGMANRV